MTAPMFTGKPPCRGADPELFFPPDPATARDRIRQAKEICARCPFIGPCRDYSLWAKAGTYYVAGVWGGTTETERERIRSAERKRRTAA